MLEAGFCCAGGGVDGAFDGVWVWLLESTDDGVVVLFEAPVPSFGLVGDEVAAPVDDEGAVDELGVVALLGVVDEPDDGVDELAGVVVTESGGGT